MYLVLDLETTSKEYYKRKANPFYNRILTIGLKFESKIDPIAVEWTEEIQNKFKIDEKISLIVGHNLKFDMLYLWDKLQDFFNRGGQVWDTQLAEYILSGQQHKYPALRDIAVNNYGCKERVKNIAENIKKGIMTEEMSIKELIEDVKNDVLDTEKVYLGQVSKSKKTNMFNLIRSQMDALLATTSMEFNGIKIDLNILNKNKKQLINELEDNKKSLNILVDKYWKFSK